MPDNDNKISFWSSLKHQTLRPTALEQGRAAFDGCKIKDKPNTSSVLGSIAGATVGTIVFFTKPLTATVIAAKNASTRKAPEVEDLERAKNFFSKSNYEALTPDEKEIFQSLVVFIKKNHTSPSSHSSKTLLELIQVADDAQKTTPKEQKEKCYNVYLKEFYSKFKDIITDTNSHHIGKIIHKSTVNFIATGLQRAEKNEPPPSKKMKNNI